MNTSNLSDTAKIICHTNLDIDLLGWSDNQFYRVGFLSCLWRNISCLGNGHKQQDCDYQMVAGKIYEFLENYRGELEGRVAEQLTKLENKSIVSQPKSSLSIDPPFQFSSKPAFPSEERPDFKALFWKLMELTYHEAQPHYLPSLPIDERCCRTDWIYCPRRTVVFPPTESGEYIHANTVNLGKDLNFIATIYPFINRALFWQMVQMKGNLIVDVTNENDISRHSIKPYYPNEVNETFRSEEMQVTCLEAKQLTPTLFHYTLLVKNLETGEEKKVDRIHYIGWEDVDGTNENQLLEVIEAMQPYLYQADVPVVHCMGGVGRTGTLLTGVALVQLHRDGQLHTKNRLHHIRDIIIEGRKHRGLEFVQTDTQIETLWNLTDLMAI